MTSEQRNRILDVVGDLGDVEQSAHALVSFMGAAQYNIEPGLNQGLSNIADVTHDCMMCLIELMKEGGTDNA